MEQQVVNHGGLSAVLASAKALLSGCVVVCLWLGGFQLQYLLALCRRALADVSRSARSSDRSLQRRRHHEHRRQHVANHGFLRSSYLGSAVVYTAALTYVQATSPHQLQAGQVTGLLLAYCVAAFVVWSTVMALVPFFDGMLVEWSHALSIMTFAVYALYCNFAPTLGIMHSVNNIERVLSYNLFWLLEDVPLTTYQSSLSAMTILHLVSHVGHMPYLLTEPGQLLPIAALYIGLGAVVPRLTHSILRYTLKPSRLPSPLFRLLCVSANVLSVTDLIMRIPSVAQPIQDAMHMATVAPGRSLGWAPVLTWVLPQPEPGQAYAYGLAPGLCMACSTVLLLTTLSSCCVLTLCEEPVPASEHDTDHPRHDQDQIIRRLSQIEAMKHVLAFMRSLPSSHRYVLCGVLALGSMQVVGLAGLLFSMVLLPGEVLLRHVPTVLASILAGLILQVAGVVHLVAPPASGAQRSASHEPLLRPTPGNSSSRWPLSNTSSQVMNSTNTLMDSSFSRKDDSGGLPSAADQTTEFVARLEALAHYKAFMQGLDAQPDSYTMDDFISGSASAMKGVFPLVHHSSFCLLNAAGSSVNMYTFLGEGSQKPPRFNVAVAPSTLIYHVLNNCRPVFVSNISQFPGPFSDVQFMRFVLGLRSVACLPLVSSQGRVLGVLRLGFQEAWEWTDPEKNVAKQVAFILSSGRNMDAGSASNTVFQQPPQQTSLPSADMASQAGSLSRPLQKRVSGGSQHSQGHGIIGSVVSASNPHQMQRLGSAADRGNSSQSGPGEGAIWGSSAPILRRPYGGASASAAIAGNSGIQFASPMSSSASMQVPPPQRFPPHHRPSQSSQSVGNIGAYGVPGWPTAGHGSTSASQRSSHQQQYPQQQQQQVHGNSSVLTPTSLGVLDQASGPTYRNPTFVPGNDDRWETGSHYSNASGSTVQAAGRTGTARRGHRGHGSQANLQAANQSGMDTQSVDGFEQSGPGGAPDDLKLLEVIGRGGFGSVYKAQWRGRAVAVKVLEHGDDFLGCAEGGGGSGVGGSSVGGGPSGKESVDRKMDLSGRRAALLEGAMTSTINHPNVVATYDYRVVHLTPQPTKGLGSSSRISQETHIVMEWCDKGSLQDAMEKGFFAVDKGGSKTIDMEGLCMTLSEVASAMAYLHTHRITHRDLKPKNVLLKTSAKDRRGFCAKVSDFGLSQVLPDTNRTLVSKNYSGTVTHMPPELIEDGKVYPQGDVYAFGIMMWEAFTGSTPYAHMAHPQIMVAVVTHNLRPRFPDACPAWYKALAYKCWAKDPKARPTFASVTDVLMAQVRDGAWEAVAPQEDGRT